MNRLPQSFCGEFVPLELLSPSRTRGALRVCKRGILVWAMELAWPTTGEQPSRGDNSFL
jgi:hypothetical protein